MRGFINANNNMNDNETQRAIGELNGMVKTGFDSIGKKFDSVDSLLKEHSGKLDALKSYQDMQAGKSSVVSALIGGTIGAAVTFIGAWITGKIK